ncbi:hypothetical protein WA556_005023 [Blastocystis sp. ATCC 50177/Nand II]
MDTLKIPQFSRGTKLLFYTITLFFFYRSLRILSAYPLGGVWGQAPVYLVHYDVSVPEKTQAEGFSVNSLPAKAMNDSPSIVPCRLHPGLFNGKKVVPLKRRSDFVVESVVRRNRSALPRAFLSKSHKYRLVLTTWVGEKELSAAVANTLQSLWVFQQFLNTRVVVFAWAQPVVSACLALGLDVVPSYPSNFAGLPLLREMLAAAQRLHTAPFYGFVDSEVLLSPALAPLLDALETQHARKRLTDGFLVAGVAFEAPVKAVPVASVTAYAKFVNRAQHKRRAGAREASDFWVVHRSAELELMGDVVVGRAGLDRYVVGLASTLQLSVVDVTFGAIAVRQTQKGKQAQQAQQAQQDEDAWFNAYCAGMQRLEAVALSLPGDRVAYWSENQEVVVERWGRGEAREKKREELQAMLLLSDKQMPKKFV